jgi:NAD(P)-dependent dehydrogenase (short-subunit alcohol dehydrogenase family)
MRLESKVALVTGAGSGIGQATALLFAAEGAKVVVVDVDSVRAEETAKKIKARGGEALALQVDATKSSQVETAVARAVSVYGRLDILFNNVGIVLIRELVDTTEDEWDTMLKTNLKSAFLFSKFGIPHMRKHGGGAIVNTGSELGLVGCPSYTAYCASKGGVVLLTKALALECSKWNIRVNCICPGATKTRMLDSEIAHYADKESITKSIIQNVPLGRIANPDEIARAVLYLASDESSYTTGAVLSVDGGTTAK